MFNQARSPVKDLLFETALWIGILAPPLLWLFELQVSYSMVSWACLHHRPSSLRVLGIIVLTISAIPLILSSLACVRLPAEGEPTEQPRESRQYFMSRIGIMSSAAFMLVIAMQSIPPFILSPCVE
jgi:hypothetical protein